MDKELKQQIDSWTNADEHQNVIDTLEKISPSKRNFEETGLLARAYNYIGKYETALALLESTLDEGAQDTNWNFRMGYALYNLDRIKEALSYFTKANELTPDDEDTIDFIRCCNKEMPFKNRVDDFWQWFLQNEAELSRIVEKRSEYDADDIIRFITQGTDLITENVYFNIGGGYEFTFSIEGNSHLFYLYPYLISRMPEKLKGKWRFFPITKERIILSLFRCTELKLTCQKCMWQSVIVRSGMILPFRFMRRICVHCLKTKVTMLSTLCWKRCWVKGFLTSIFQRLSVWIKWEKECFPSRLSVDISQKH